MRPPVAHAERTSRPTCVPLERLLAGPTGGRTIGGCQCGSAGPRLAALCADRGVAFRGAPCGAPGAARRGAPDGARGAASRAARGAADGRPPPTAGMGELPCQGPISRGQAAESRRGAWSGGHSSSWRSAKSRREGRGGRDAQGQPSLRQRPAASGRPVLPAARHAAARPAAAATRPSAPPRGRADGPRWRRADARWPARWSPAFRGAERRQPAQRTRRHSPPWVGHTAGVARTVSRPARGASGAPDRRRTGACAKSPLEPARASSARPGVHRIGAWRENLPLELVLGCGEVGRRRAGHGCTSLTMPAPMASRTEYPAGVRRFLPAQGLACGGTECHGRVNSWRAAMRSGPPHSAPGSPHKCSDQRIGDPPPRALCRPAIPPPYRYHAANLPLGKANLYASFLASRATTLHAESPVSGPAE